MYFFVPLSIRISILVITGKFMMRGPTTLCSVLMGLCLIPSFSQPNKNGIPLITNYDFRITGGSEQNWCITQDHRGVMYFGNNDAGVLEYDGVSWRSIPLPGNPIVRFLKTGDDGVVYVGAESGFGFLEPDDTGNMRYRSISDSIEKKFQSFGEVWKIYDHEGDVFFCTYPNIYKYDVKSGGLEIIELPQDAYFCFLIDSTLYTSDFGSGLMYLDGNGFRPATGGEKFREMSITAMVKTGSGELLVGTYFSGLFLYDIHSGRADNAFLDPELNGYLRSAVITDIHPYREDFIVATLYDGLVIMDSDWHFKETITKKEGLIDLTITSVFSSNGGPLWATNFMGVSKLEINSPFRVFTEKQGIEDFITDILNYNGDLYISSYGGVFRKNSQSFKTEFIKLDGIEGAIYDLQLFHPSTGEEFLLASGSGEIWMIDPQMNVQAISGKVIAPSQDPYERKDYGGFKMLPDRYDPDLIYAGNDNIVCLRYTAGRWRETLRVGLNAEKIRKMEFDREGNIWISTYKTIFRLNSRSALFYSASEYGIGKGLPEGNANSVFTDPVTKSVLFGTANGFYTYDYQGDTIIRESVFNEILPCGSNYVHGFYRDHEGDYWVSYKNEVQGWSELVAQRSGDSLQILFDNSFNRLEDASTDVFFSDPVHGCWFGKSRELYHFDKSALREGFPTFYTLIRKVVLHSDSAIFSGTGWMDDKGTVNIPPSKGASGHGPEIEYAFGNLEFEWSAPFFEKEDGIEYSYLLQGFHKDWSSWSKESGHYFTSLPPGKYTLKVKSRNIYGNEGGLAEYPFTILPPWYLTIWAFIGYLVIFVLTVFGLVRFFTRKLKQRAAVLERRNIEIENQRKELETRNIEIVRQKAELENLNEEITAQRDEIEAQRDSIMRHKDLIDAQKTAITDSIHYARRIQDAVLPAGEVLRFLLPKHFVFYRPQLIVSGDFYWVDKKDEIVLLALGDCTGHGVPGAFMSMLGISLLNEISHKYADHPTNELMDELRDQVIASLGQTGSEDEAKDGMDMGLVALNTKTREVQFTGAERNLYIFRKGVLEEVKGDRMPVGIHSISSKLFTAHNIQLNRGDSIYLFSDGFPDQFGGENGKKYGYTRLKAFLSGLQELIMHDQLKAIAGEFDQWKGDEEQVDDVLMIGIKV
jgi:serine phosphatase RsbU (regulator of sigma subunit)